MCIPGRWLRWPTGWFPTASGGECKPHADEPEKYAKRVLKFLSQVEAGGE